MTLIIPVSGANEIEGGLILPLEPPLVPIPQLWNGLQFSIYP